ncbi:hypothetical protein WBO78_28590, partial [Bosea sp. CCNWLW174]|uniref:hypothetical protein n=1 Tax=unclassified Bosea (in: a-proteobacteria) TaxID=2653178 RepID=UPI003014FEAD
PAQCAIGATHEPQLCVESSDRRSIHLATTGKQQTGEAHGSRLNEHSNLDPAERTSEAPPHRQQD